MEFGHQLKKVFTTFTSVMLPNICKQEHQTSEDYYKYVSISISFFHKCSTFVRI